MNQIFTIIKSFMLIVLCFIHGTRYSLRHVTLQVRDAELAEVVEMIAHQHQVNILMSGEVSGTVSISLYDTPLREALSAIANTAGYALEKQGSNFFILRHDQIGTYKNGSLTRVRVYDVDYVEGEELKSVVEDHLSLYGKANFIPKRRVLIVQDQPEFLRDIDRLMAQIDRQPQQVLIEAKILEVTLNDDESLGIDWQNLFQSNGGSGGFGVSGNTTTNEGFFFDLITPDVEVALRALQDEGRLNTLSTPKLVALENEEASVVIGDRRGYQVTTTINQVTTESIEFLESGVILRVTAEIDATGKILMNVHPEVSNGTVDANGIPSQTTTEVTTNILVPSGETIFIGGLLKQTESVARRSVPVVNRVPGLRRLFSSKERNRLATETVVLIRPIIADDLEESWNTDKVDAVDGFEMETPELEPWRLLPETAAVEHSVPAPPEGIDSSIEVDSEGGRSIEAEGQAPDPADIAAVVTSGSSIEATIACAPPEVRFCYDDYCRCETD